ncbi:sulfotransferase [Halovulum dunhuangense]|uniref:Sulfotransferase n=1 Tax=Halovulum dunhuangense TaxID=1505036 RepID=A0A849KX78_9RHOB|nr:sulfotransferase [Halovulum dunhuangense]NNU79067.1 sulfotransferase [Halovulum dunhuangense]
MNRRPPPAHAIAIGAQKCASSWLHDMLAAHPGIARAGRKELDFFSYHHDRGHAWYRAQFPRTGLRFENSPSYLHDPRAPGRAHAFDPDARILVTLRDPVARAWSHHLHEIATGHIAPQPFETALRDNPDYLEQGFYARHLAPWVARFGAGRVLVVLTEDIAADPEAQRRRMLDFLGLDPGPPPARLAERRNVSSLPRSAALRHALRHCGAAMRGLGLDGALARLKRTPPLSTLRHWNEPHLATRIPPLAEETRHALGLHFADDMRALADLLGTDTLPWDSWRRIADPQTCPSAMNRAAASRPAMRLPSATGWVPSADIQPAGRAT